jgi:hypothetical protein
MNLGQSLTGAFNMGVWDVPIPSVIFAIRNVPFELLYSKNGIIF